MKYVIKCIFKTNKPHSLKTQRGFEKYISTQHTVSEWPKFPALIFNSLNEAFKYKEHGRDDSLPYYYYIVEELK